ncbi:MAG: ORF6N domain-containing protein [Deltaproteobacteria bacterium]|nr:ORF6N domain-containing protein [Deltaproteobacteria bacterium]
MAACYLLNEIIVDELSSQNIGSLIFLIRGHKVMLDDDLARLYGVKTKTLNQAIKRNAKRFPPDFMFQLIEIESKNLRSQFVTSSLNYGGRRYLPYVFTELGIAMLSSVLKSEQAIQVNIAIMRTFFKLRKLLAEDATLARKIQKAVSNSNKLFRVVFERLDRLEATAPILPPNRRKIGI